jgi:aspartokinase
MVPNAATLDEVSYTEAGELAFFGAKVLHPMTLRPVIESAIPVWIRNSFQPQLAGTKITHSGGRLGVKAVTASMRQWPDRHRVLHHGADIAAALPRARRSTQIS